MSRVLARSLPLLPLAVLLRSLLLLLLLMLLLSRSATVDLDSEAPSEEVCVQHGTECRGGSGHIQTKKT